MRLAPAAALATVVLLNGCAETGFAPSHPVAWIPDSREPVCAVTRVVDGDTVAIACRSGAETNARLMGFDTPETYRPGCPAERAAGERARKFLDRTLRNADRIVPKLEGTDKYQRALVMLWIDGKPLDDIMVGAGMAVPYSGGKRIDWCARLRAG